MHPEKGGRVRSKWNLKNSKNVVEILFLECLCWNVVVTGTMSLKFQNEMPL